MKIQFIYYFWIQKVNNTRPSIKSFTCNFCNKTPESVTNLNLGGDMT